MLDQEIWPMSAAMNRDALVQMIENVDENHKDAHDRLRKEITLLDHEIKRLEDGITKGLNSLREGYLKNEAKINEVEKMPIDAMKLMLTPRVVGVIVAFCIAIAGGQWAASYGARGEMQKTASDVRDILTRMEASKAAQEASAKLQEVQSNAVKTAIDDMKRRQELQQYEIQGLKEAFITGKGRAIAR